MLCSWPLGEFQLAQSSAPPEPLSFPQGSSVGSLLKGQSCFPCWTIRRAAMPTAQPHSALQPSVPCPSLLWDPCSFGRCFSSAFGWVEWVGGTVASHRSVHQQPEWVILNRKLPTSQRERFVLIPPDLCPECHPSLTRPAPPSGLIFCPAHGPSFAQASAQYPCRRTVCLTGNSVRMVNRGWHEVGAVLIEGLWRRGEM